jgi:phosphoribosylamine--glycine ligase
VVRPAIAELTQRGIGYRGVLFSGIMMTDEGPKCLEYNVRFGDPETQTVMRRLGSGLAEALMCAACGEPIRPIEVLDNAVTTVVLASGGYPGEYAKGKPITIGDIGKAGSGENVKVFHAGTVLKDGQLVTNGGRVLGVSAVGATVKESTQLAYDAIESISFEGMHFRTDIGA